jgi:hypothetical protein
MGKPEAQIEFTTSASNPGRLWHLPQEFYQFSCGQESGMTVDFFAIDTNGICDFTKHVITSLIYYLE